MIYWGNLRKLVLSVGTNGAILLIESILLLSHAPTSVSTKKVQRASHIHFFGDLQTGLCG